MSRSQKILFLCPYPANTVASQRFRFEQYLDLLTRNGFDHELRAFTTEKGWRILQDNGKFTQKFFVLFVAFSLRFLTLLNVFRFDFIFVHREATPLGPPVIEWIIARLMKKKLIYDFDDSIWLTDESKRSNFYEFIKWRRKSDAICSWSYKVSTGNSYLASYAKQFNRHVIVNPTTIDTTHLHNKTLYKRNTEPWHENKINEIVIGWTGSYTTIKYLEWLLPVLQKIEEAYPSVTLLVIADRKPNLSLNNMIFKKWSKETEITDLLLADIGIMPLPDNDWTRGKCGFKALQYMSLEIPAIVSPVGVNQDIVLDGVNGLCCRTEDEWFSCISKLIVDSTLRSFLGKNGRKTVTQEYSVASNFSNFLSLFQ